MAGRGSPARQDSCDADVAHVGTDYFAREFVMGALGTVEVLISERD